MARSFIFVAAYSVISCTPSVDDPSDRDSNLPDNTPNPYGQDADAVPGPIVLDKVFNRIEVTNGGRLEVPVKSATLTGHVNKGYELFVEGVGDTIVERINANGDFCVDISPGDFATVGSFDVTMFAENVRGLGPEFKFTLQFYDPTLPDAPYFGPITSEVATCGGVLIGTVQSAQSCEGQNCAACPDDTYESVENDILNASGPAPSLCPEFSRSLTICPTDNDYFTIPNVVQGQTISVSINFAKFSDGRLKMELYNPNDGIVATSTTTDAGETLTYVANTVAGNYKVRIYGVGAADTNDYVYSCTIGS